jgi:hypothetical protein
MQPLTNRQTARDIPALWHMRVAIGWRVILFEAVLLVMANLVEKIFGILAVCIRQRQALALIVKKRRLDGLLPDVHHVVIGVSALV